jgi:TIR domain
VFRGSVLRNTDFTAAITGLTSFDGVDLSETTGLELVNHQGASTVGIDTIYKSHGKIPEVFLRGCGVPDEFLAYIGSMVGRPIEYYSCFISYSTHDQEFAERLQADLRAKWVRCWFATHDIKGGRKIHEQIDEAIRLHDRLLLILSEHSMSSEWVKTEIAKARKREAKEGKRVLFPVRLVGFETLRDWECFDGDTGKDSAREIREYHIPDFSNWKDHDSYQTAFQRLVSDLKAEASG